MILLVGDKVIIAIENREYQAQSRDKVQRTRDLIPYFKFIHSTQNDIAQQLDKMFDYVKKIFFLFCYQGTLVNMQGQCTSLKRI